jgi:hypothetical protein
MTCGHKWKEPPGRVTCPICVILDPDIADWKDHYVTWLNFDDVDWNRDDRGRRCNR